MARRRCLNCGTLTDQTRCADCRKGRDRERNRARTHYHGTYQADRAALKANATHCALCGQPLPGTPWPHPDSTTADHIHPADPTSPLQAAHLRCNASRGNRPHGPDQSANDD